MESGSPTKHLAAPPECDFYLFTHMSDISAAMKCVDEHAIALCNLLARGRRKGILVLYWAPGESWRQMVRLVHESHTVQNSSSSLRGSDLVAELQRNGRRLETLRNKLEELQQACRSKMQLLEHKFPELKDLHRVRIISPLDLSGVLENIRSRIATDFVHFFHQTSYDTPKIVGAILRLRGIGNSMPVLRFDEDVLFNAYTLRDGMARVQDAIMRAVDAHLFRSKSLLQSLVFSAQYVHVGVTDSSSNERYTFKPWNQGFATRCTPALLASSALCNTEQFEQEDWVPSESDLDDATDALVMMRFYGLQENQDGRLELCLPSAQLDHEYRREEDIAKLGITYIGANPLRACVSGAALCIPPGASLDLPPFSHFSQNVMWIDDHCLHTLTREVEGSNPVSTALSNSSMGNVVKARTLPSKCAWYTLEAYLPALLYGCIMDAWINNHKDAHILKYPLDSMFSGPLQSLWHSLRRADNDGSVTPGGPFSRSIKEVIQRGRMYDKDELQQLRDDLWDVALCRIRDAYWQWSRVCEQRLPGKVETKNCPSFANLWVTSKVAAHSQLGLFCDVPWARPSDEPRAKRLLRLGAGLVHPQWHQSAAGKRRCELPPLHMTDLNPHIAKSIGILVQSTLTHLEWVLIWPSVVQAVRSINYGRLPCDAVWQGLLKSNL